MKLIKKQISGITYFSIDNLSISLDVSKRYNINLWSEGTQKQGNYAKTLYFDDTLEEWRTRDCECSNKDKSLDFSIVIENNTLKSLETLKIYGIDNGGVHIFNEVYFELNEIGGSGGTPITELPIKYEETYDPSKVVSGYLTSFSDIYNVLYYKLANGNIVFLPTSTYRWQGEILGATQNGNNLVIRRQGIGTLTYSPTVSADITSYNYSDTSTHVVSGRAEANWWLIIPKTSFGSTTNILNVRSTKATATSTAGNVDLSASSIVSVWKLVDATSLPEAQEIDPNAAIGDLMVLLDVRNTSNAQVTVNDVEFVIQATLGGVEPQIKIYSHSIMIAHRTDNIQVVFQVLSILSEAYNINDVSNNKMLRATIGIPAVRVSSPTTAEMIIFKSNGTQFVINGTEYWDIADCVLMVDDIVDLTNTEL